eukprot:gnl/Chilomastix_cuspidata/754.p1 GENE.gnl/Chilomastix_cuspidata/754~~gnl/Chilomastix_cuspidata/754.p1  ORF type:complete len:553 (+),score=247.65 gnl/Chilomastix_cuspidata/754:39-1661(+)
MASPDGSAPMHMDIAQDSYSLLETPLRSAVIDWPSLAGPDDSTISALEYVAAMMDGFEEAVQDLREDDGLFDFFKAFFTLVQTPPSDHALSVVLLRLLDAVELLRLASVRVLPFFHKHFLVHQGALSPAAALLEHTRSADPMVALLAAKLLGVLLESFSRAGMSTHVEEAYRQYHEDTITRLVELLGAATLAASPDASGAASPEESSSFRDHDAADALPAPVAGEPAFMSHRARVKALQGLIPLMYLLRTERGRDTFRRVGGVAALVRTFELFMVKKEAVSIVHAAGRAAGALSPSLGAKGQRVLAMDVIYHALVALWLLTYDVRAVPLLCDSGAFDSVMNIFRVTGTPKLKLMSVIGFLFENLKDSKPALSCFIGLGACRILVNIARRKFADEEIDTAFREFAQRLEEENAKLSTFEAYLSELQARRLEWTPAHRSDVFWGENVHRFDENHFEFLRNLVALMKEAAAAGNDTTLAVAVHDIGRYAATHPRGRTVLARQFPDVKPFVTELLVHENPEVQSCAITCCTQLLLTQWSQVSTN